MREGTMKVIAPGDKRRQVASGVGVYEERRGNTRRDNESDCTWLSFDLARFSLFTSPVRHACVSDELTGAAGTE